MINYSYFGQPIDPAFGFALISRDGMDVNFLYGVRLILRSKLGKMTVHNKRPKLLPTIAQDERAKCETSLAAIDGPSHT